MSVFDLLGEVFAPQNLKDDWQNIQCMPQQEDYSEYEDISEYERIKNLHNRESEYQRINKRYSLVTNQ